MKNWITNKKLRRELANSFMLPLFFKSDENEDDGSRKNTNELVFGLSKEVTANYSTKRVHKSITYKKYIHDLKKEVIKNPQSFIEAPFQRYAYVTGKVKSGGMISSLDKYLLLLDCDSIKDRDSAVAFLDKKKIRSFQIQSSPGKYWVVGDKVDTVKNNTYLMEEIPGVDQRFTSCSKTQGILLYRGFPKPGFIPQFDDTSEFKGMGCFEKWILKFKEYWESEDMEEISGNLFAEAI
jgi:hypothetical protein